VPAALWIVEIFWVSVPVESGFTPASATCCTETEFPSSVTQTSFELTLTFVNRLRSGEFARSADRKPGRICGLTK